MVREISTEWMTSRAGAKGTIVRLCVLLVVLQAIFLGLLVLAQAVPDDPIVAHLLEAVEDGTYASNLEPDNMGGTSSSFTECVLVGTGLGRPELGPCTSAAIAALVTKIGHSEGRSGDQASPVAVDGRAELGLFTGAGCGNRTHDLMITSQVLYQLS